MARTSPERQPDEPVRELELDHVPVCTACLGIVAFAVDHGDPRQVRRELNATTPILWDEGLAEPAREARTALRLQDVARGRLERAPPGLNGRRDGRSRRPARPPRPPG